MPDHPELLPCPFCGQPKDWIDNQHEGLSPACTNQDCFAYAIPMYFCKEGALPTRAVMPVAKSPSGKSIIAPAEIVSDYRKPQVMTYDDLLYHAERMAECLEQLPRWTPVTERLPEIPDNSEWEDRFVLCTFEDPDGRRYVLETHYLDGEFSVGDEISIDFTPPNYIGQMYEGKDTKLVAWMYKPLPQPPKEVEG